MAAPATGAHLLHLVQRALSLLDQLVVPAYFLLSFLAPLALVGGGGTAAGPSSSSSSSSGFFQKLAAHGKALHGSSSTSGVRPRNKNGTKESSSRRSTSARWPSSLVARGWDKANDWLFRRDGRFYVPKRYFSHFYVVGTVQLVVCVSLRWQPNHSPLDMMVWGLLGLHLARRYFECRWVHRWTRQSQMHVAGYALGILHYLLLPLVFCPDDDDARGAETRPLPTKPTAAPLVVVVVVGRGTCAALCLCAQYQQYRHHRILANLRIHHDSRGLSSTASAAPSYSIPTGGGFQYVSSPHYLAEILVYGSLVALAMLHQPGGAGASCRRRHVALLVWVVDNLTVSALATHKWYMRQFPNEYPQLNRKALVPHLL